MAVIKEVIIDGRPVRFMASARTPRIYRQNFGRDIMVDMASLSDSFKKAEGTDAQLSIMDLTIFENLAYVMAKQADDTIPGTIDEWLDDFSTFDIYEVFPELMSLWSMNRAGLSKAKKK